MYDRYTWQMSYKKPHDGGFLILLSGWGFPPPSPSKNGREGEESHLLRSFCISSYTEWRRALYCIFCFSFTQDDSSANSRDAASFTSFLFFACCSFTIFFIDTCLDHIGESQRVPAMKWHSRRYLERLSSWRAQVRLSVVSQSFSEAGFMAYLPCRAYGEWNTSHRELKAFSQAGRGGAYLPRKKRANESP